MLSSFLAFFFSWGVSNGLLELMNKSVLFLINLVLLNTLFYPACFLFSFFPFLFPLQMFNDKFLSLILFLYVGVSLKSSEQCLLGSKSINFAVRPTSSQCKSRRNFTVQAVYRY